jgi:hypothetical protein
MTQKQIFVVITQINALTGIRTQDYLLRRQGHDHRAKAVVDLKWEM